MSGREKMVSAPETDYRAISQQYAQGGINAVILVNGGAAVAVLSQLGGLKGLADPTAIGWTLICFVCGVFFGLISWVFAFMSTRYVDRFLRGQEASYVKADRYMHAGLLTVACSSGGFLVGCLILAFSYMGQQQLGRDPTLQPGGIAAERPPATAPPSEHLRQPANGFQSLPQVIEK